MVLYKHSVYLESDIATNWPGMNNTAMGIVLTTLENMQGKTFPF